MTKPRSLSVSTVPVIAMIPLESLAVIAGALLLAALVIALLQWLGSRLLPQLKSMSTASIKIPGLNVTVKGGGLMVLFLSLFVLIVVLYAVLRMVPGTP